MRIFIPVIIIVCLCFQFNISAQIIYVAPDGTGDGSSWIEASGNLPDILTNSSTGAEIWVAAGVYLPHTTDRNASFVIPSGVAIYGGFNGTEANQSERDPVTNLTILSGAVGTPSDEDNSYSVVRTLDVSSATLLDGFIIEHGMANDDGGGFDNPDRAGGGWHNKASNGSESSPTITDCIFRNNYASGFGGGMANIADYGATCTSLISNCVFENNICDNDGGGLYNGGKVNGNCKPQIIDCIFDSNTAGNGGGAIYNNGQDGLCNPVIDRCQILNNYSDYAGGGIYSFGKDGAADAQISNSLIIGNIAQFGGGGIYNLGNGTGSASPTVLNCTFTLNSSVVGGAMYNNAGNAQGTASPNITNCIFWNNPTSAGGSVFRANFGTPNISYSIVDVAECNDLNSGSESDVTCGPGMLFNINPDLTPTYGIPVGSPAINVGSNVPLNLLGLVLNLNQQPRIQNALVDLGATETFSPNLDTDNDGIPDDTDNCPTIANTNQLDADMDNFGAVCDCDDTEATINDNAIEICDGLDNNCDGIIDEGFDLDGDGFKICEGDCDDTDPTIFPGAIELCDGIDNNCNDIIDEGADPIARYPDLDGDLLGDANANPSFDCPPLPGYVEDNTDCDDTNPFLPQAPGTLCNDGDPNTTGDMIQDDGCTCLGIPGTSGYCATLGMQPWVEWISNVDFGDIQNSSFKEQYADFTGLTTDVSIGNSFPITVQANFAHPHYDEYIRIWIDFNQDADFEDIGELVLEAIHPIGPDGTLPPALIGDLDIPVTATLGSTRMRISMQREAYADPCDSFEYGEVEDYSISIINDGPVLSLDCPADQSLTAAVGATTTVATWIIPTPTTTCPAGITTILQTTGLAPGEDFPIGNNTITYEATDECGNTETCSFDINVIDGGAALLTLDYPADQSLTTAIGATTAVATWTIPTPTTTCHNGITTILQTAGLAPGQDFPIGNNTITYEATDECGNTESCSFNIIVNDGGSIGNGYCESRANQPWVEWIGNVTLSDLNNTSSKSGYSDLTTLVANVNTGENYQLSVQPVFSYTHYTEYIQVWIDFNQNENFNDPGELVVSAIYTNGVNGTTPSPISENILIPANATSGTTRMRVAMQKNQASTPCEIFDLGEVEDYTVNITNSGPTLTLDCSDDFRIDAGIGATSGIITWTEPSLSTTCPDNITTLLQISGPANASTQPVGNYTISYEATDNCGNIETCSFTIIVNDSDMTTLTLDCPPNQTLTTLPGATTISATWNVPVPTTECPSGIIDILQTTGLPSGSLFPIGVNNISYEVSDDCGDIETCSFTITVNDGGPVGNGYCESSASAPWVDWIGNVSLNDLNNPSNKAGYNDFTNLVANADIGGSYQIIVQPIFSYTHFTEYIQVWIDFNQNESFADPGELVVSAVYTNGINGTSANPVIQNITIPSGATVGNTRMRVSMNRTEAAGPCELFGFGEVEDYTVNLINSGPVLSLSCGSDINIDAGLGAISGVIAWSAPTFGTTCPTGVPNLIQTSGPANGSSQALGTYPVAYEATDDCGNIETCSFTVTLSSDPASLSLSCPVNQNLTAAVGSTTAIANWNTPLPTTTCPGGNITIDQIAGLVAGSDFPIGTSTITYEAADDCGNIETCSFTITVNDGGPVGNGYCASAASAPWEEWIGNVSFNDLDNTSGKNGYGDFTSLTANVIKGEIYTLSIQPIFSYTHYTEYIQVWIDYNGNENFSDPGELVVSTIYENGINGSIAPPITEDITIPGNAPTGATRMRVIMSRDAAAGPCENFTTGEVEDYTLNIGQAPANAIVNSDVILNLSTYVEARTVQLNWASNQDVETTAYAIERKGSNGDFTEIAQVASYDNTQRTHFYSYTDRSVTDGHYEYRIVALKQDGSTAFTNVQAVEIGNEVGRLSAFPNPAHSQVTLMSHLLLEHSVNLMITNSLGQIIHQKQYDATNEQRILLEVSNYPNGIYLVRFQAGKRKALYTKLVVERE